MKGSQRPGGHASSLGDQDFSAGGASDLASGRCSSRRKKVDSDHISSRRVRCKLQVADQFREAAIVRTGSSVIPGC